MAQWIRLYVPNAGGPGSIPDQQLCKANLCDLHTNSPSFWITCLEAAITGLHKVYTVSGHMTSLIWCQEQLLKGVSYVTLKEEDEK